MCSQAVRKDPRGRDFRDHTCFCGEEGAACISLFFQEDLARGKVSSQGDVGVGEGEADGAQG